MMNRLLTWVAAGGLLLSAGTTSAQEISFGATGLSGENVNNPTSLAFGPDNRLYVATQAGTVWAFNISRDNGAPGSGQYSVTQSEAINLVKEGVQNHTDDGLATTVKERQVTGIYLAGTSNNPILYVSSSDSLIGGKGAGNDKNLDTNSGMLSKLTWNGTQWDKVCLLYTSPSPRDA